MDETIAAGEDEYSALVSKMQAAGIEVLFLGGYHREGGLIFRQARDRSYDLQLVANSAMTPEDFPMIAGPGLEGTVMAAVTDTRGRPEAAEVVAQFPRRAMSPWATTLYAYAAVQVWAQAVEAAGALDLAAVTEVMHSRQFDTVLGQSASTPKATSRVSSRGAGTCGRPMAPTCRWSQASTRTSERKPSETSGFFRVAARRAGAQNILHMMES